MIFPRASGILLHPTSLPGPYGIGDLGDEAYRAADFLVDAGQSLWQVLPLGPTGYGGSPYSSYSASAGNTLLISPRRLVEAGLLIENDLTEIPPIAPNKVDFAAAQQSKDALLKKALANHRANQNDIRADLEIFVQENSSWLDDYSLFRALKSAHNEAPWYEWEPALAQHDAASLDTVRAELREQIDAEKLAQFLFFKQWSEVKAYCNTHGIKIIGDIPIFVAYDSADVWTHQEQFKLNADGSPIVVAGVPPDYFSDTGQYWGNPLFNWECMKADGFAWWIERVGAAFQMFDIVRLDHFRGFVASWEIPAGETTAENGQWVDARGHELFEAIKQALGDLPIIAEDLGVITPEVERLRDDFGFPGMRVLQFAFGSDATNTHLPHNYDHNVVAYTATHDNDTTVGWFRSLPEENEREFCLKYLNTNGAEVHWDFIRAALASVADTAIVPMQDVLGLGNEGRMNLPNSKSGNWEWRMEDGALTSDLAQRLRVLSELYGRIPPSENSDEHD
jgi:4-alpha-glucanotransferase